MSVIIKSDKKASVSLGNINGIKGPQDWSIFLDFENEAYATQSAGVIKKDYLLSDVVEATRSNLNGSPVSIDKNGIEKTITSTIDIRTALLRNGRFGLLAEDTNENFFLNSSAPASQTISMAAAATRIIVSCEGSGSITVNGDVVGAGAIITKDTPRIFDRVSTSAACNLNLVVNGSLTHAQVELATGSHTSSSKIKTTSASSSRAREIVKVKRTLFNSVIQNKSAFTVLVQTIDFNPVINPANHVVNRFGLENLGSSVKVLKMGGLSNNLYHGYTMQYIDSTATNNTAILKDSFNASSRFYPYNQAVAINSGGIRAAFNGIAEGALSIANPFLVSDITFGSGYPSPIGRNGLRGIVTKLVVYDRVLTQEEVTELTKSWI